MFDGFFGGSGSHGAKRLASHQRLTRSRPRGERDRRTVWGGLQALSPTATPTSTSITWSRRTMAPGCERAPRAGVMRIMDSDIFFNGTGITGTVLSFGTNRSWGTPRKARLRPRPALASSATGQQ